MASYISILLPAFKLNTKDINQIKNICSLQFNTPKEEIEVSQFKDNTDKINYWVKFANSSLSLNSIEILIYEKNCLKILTDKVFESLNDMSKKLKELEEKLNSYSTNSINNINNDNKLKQLIQSKIEYSDNIEKTLNKIKEDFKLIVLDLEKIRKKNEDEDNGGKKYINNNYIINNYFCDSNLTEQKNINKTFVEDKKDFNKKINNKNVANTMDVYEK